MTPVPNVHAEYRGTVGTLQTINITWNEMVCQEQSHTLYFGFLLPTRERHEYFIAPETSCERGY